MSSKVPIIPFFRFLASLVLIKRSLLSKLYLMCGTEYGIAEDSLAVIIIVSPCLTLRISGNFNSLKAYFSLSSGVLGLHQVLFVNNAPLFILWLSSLILSTWKLVETNNATPGLYLVVEVGIVLIVSATSLDNPFPNEILSSNSFNVLSLVLWILSK